jgi:hypothetical protein
VRLLDRLIPPVLRRPILVGGVVGMGVVAMVLSVGAWLLAAADVVTAVALADGKTLTGRGRARVLLGVPGVMAVWGTVGLVVEHLHAEARRQEVWAQTAQLNRAQLLPSSPGRAAGLLMRGVAASDPGICPVTFAPAARAEFAAAVVHDPGRHLDSGVERWWVGHRGSVPPALGWCHGGLVRGR